MNKTHLSASYDVDLALKVGVVAAVLFNKIVFLSRYTEREDGYCWRTAEEFERELGISRKQQEVAIKKLEEAGLIVTKNTYITNTKIKCKHFKVVADCAEKENLISTKGRNTGRLLVLRGYLRNVAGSQLGICQEVPWTEVQCLLLRENAGHLDTCI